MSSDAGGPGRVPGSDSEIDQPLEALADLETETSADFVAGVRRKIHRRAAASQFASFSWHLPGLVLVQLAHILKCFFAAAGGRKDSQS